MPSVDAESTPPAGAIRGLARILPFAGRDVYGLIAGMAISLISSALALGIPIALEALVDGPLRGDDPTLVWPAVGLIALLGLFEALFI
jgi:ATP-binding cassette subfamily B protein